MKKRGIKGLVSILFSLAVVLVAICAFRTEAKADTGLSIGTTKAGQIGDNEWQYFKITTDGTPSYYKVSLKVYDGKDGYVDLKLYSDKEHTEDFYSEGTSIGDFEEWDLKNDLKPNRSYYIGLKGGWIPEGKRLSIS